MATETRNDSLATQQAILSSGGTSPPDDFISIREIIQMILRHQRAIIAFVSLVTLATGIFFVVSPKKFEAEGYLQIIPPMSQDGRVDKELFETMIVSYLQRASSAFIFTNLSNILNKQGVQFSPLELEKKIKVLRPPKTDLIRVLTKEDSPDKALLIAELWVREYIESIRRNNIPRALSRIRSQMREAQSDLMEKQATVEKLKGQVSLTSPLVTVSRAVDDRQLWNDLNQNTLNAPEIIKKLSEIHIKSQEQNEDFIYLKKALTASEQALAAVRAKRDLFLEAERFLEVRATTSESENSMKIAESQNNTSPSELEWYLNSLLKNNEIVQFGYPGLTNTERGMVTTTSLVLLASMVLACLCAFIYEAWIKD